MDWLTAAKQWILMAMAGRTRQWGIVALLAFVTLLALTCIGTLLELPGPAQSLRTRLPLMSRRVRREMSLGHAA